MTDTELQHILCRYRRIAVVGLSPDPSRPSYGVTRYLIDAGYEIFGVRPAATKILDRPCFDRIQDVPKPVEIVDVFRAPQYVPAVVEDAIAAGAKVLWLQEGITHSEAEKRAREAGLIVISDRCMLKEHDRLLSTSAESRSA